MKWVLELAVNLACFVSAGLIIAHLAGCAAPPPQFNGLCAMQIVGSRGDVAFARVVCEADE